MIKNKLKINDDKTEFLIISSPRAKINLDCQLNIGNVSVNQSSSCRNLGVFMDSHLGMDKHIANTCRNMIFYLRKIGAIRPLLTESATCQLVHALITSRLDYCNSLMYGLPDCLLNRIQRVQNIAARIVTRCPKSSHITPVLQELHWLPVRYRILFKILLLTYRCIHGTAPEYLVDLITFYSPQRALRSSSHHLLVVPKTRTKSFGERTFTYAAAREWNLLPVHIKVLPTIEHFKSAVKTYLFKLYFK